MRENEDEDEDEEDDDDDEEEELITDNHETQKIECHKYP